MTGTLRLSLLLTFVLTPPVFAQSAPPSATVPAIFLSDIHLDPYHDPAKVARLNAAPESDWAAILAESDSPSRFAQSAALQLTCPVRGTDTSDALWRSSLHALRTQASATHPRFVTVSGDLLAHEFDCKYQTLLPNATHQQFAAFTEKTLRYVLGTLKAAIPNTPIYVALGNNDTACHDNQLAPAQDQFLGLAAPLVADLLPPTDRAAVLSTFPETGSFAAPLAGVPDTRIIVLDDLFLSSSYTRCGGGKDAAPGAAEIVWLNTQLADARAHNQRVWILAHIPPGIDLYSTARRLINVCSGAPPVSFLASPDLREALASYADVIRLALFGHTHSDEMGLIAAQGTDSAIPVKLTASITPVNGNRPTFTLARIDPKTATLKDFSVFESSNLTGVNATWTKEYTYSEAYRQPAFDPAAVSSLIAGFQADPQAATAASKAYLRNYFPGDISSLIRFAWPEYACSMNHQTAESLAGCLCKANP